MARAGKMYRVPQAGPRRPAVAGPVVQRGVMPHPVRLARLLDPDVQQPRLPSGQRCRCSATRDAGRNRTNEMMGLASKRERAGYALRRVILERGARADDCPSLVTQLRAEVRALQPRRSLEPQTRSQVTCLLNGIRSRIGRQCECLLPTTVL